MPPPYLPVITVITRPDGSSFTPVGELRIMSGLTYTVVTGDGPDRGELAPTAVATVYAPIVPVPQPPVTATGGDTTIIAFASPDGPTHFTGAVMFAGGSLLDDATNYAIVTLYDATDGTTKTAIPGATTTTTPIASGGTGPWVGGSIAIDLGLGVDLAEGHYVVAVWTHVGTGVAVPGGWWRTK